MKSKPNSGFTLTELLAGLFMSTFIVGALGFALIQILKTTSTEQAKSNTRRDTSRAIEFISDEIRRARRIEPDAANAIDPTNTIGVGDTVVLALDIPEISSSATLGADADPNTEERIVYFLRDSAGTNWQGPQVLYRYGPPIDADGIYTNGGWGIEALIDGIDDNPITASPCVGGDTLNPALVSNPSGFYACINAAQTSAQLYLTSGIDTIANNGTSNDDSFTAATQVVARAKETNITNAQAAATTPIFFRSLGADFVCDSTSGSLWTMRMNFANSPFSDPTVNTTVVDDSTGLDSGRTAANLNNSTTWIHDPNRQSQPININEANDLTIYSIPVGSTGCGSRQVNETLTATSALDGILGNNFNVSHTIRFRPDAPNNPDGNDPNFWQSFNGDNSATNHDNPNVNDDGTVLVFKNGSRIEPTSSINRTANIAAAPFYPGFDPDGPDLPGQPPGIQPKETLGEFLEREGFANLVSGDPLNGDAVYEITNLNDDERIIAFEIGQTDNGIGANDDNGDGAAHPGFDVTDNVVLVRSEAFEEDNAPTP